MSFQMHDKLAALLERDHAAQDALKTQCEELKESYTSRANFTKN